MPAIRKGLVASAILCTFVFGQASAATLTYEFTNSFGATAPDGPAPWLTAVFDDGGSAGSVELTLTVSAAVGDADVSEVYFNLNDSLDATSLSFLRTGGTGPVTGDISVYTGTNAFQADGDGIYDILLDLPPPPGQQGSRFQAGETLVFDITGIGSLTVADFNYIAEIGGSNGPFFAAAKVISTGEGGESSDWIGVVPIPAAVWLFGSGLGILGWFRRRR